MQEVVFAQFSMLAAFSRGISQRMRVQALPNFLSYGTRGIAVAVRHVTKALMLLSFVKRVVGRVGGSDKGRARRSA